MTTSHHQDRRAARPAVLLLLGALALVLGLAMVAVALTRQVPTPPSPTSTVPQDDAGATADGAPGAVPGPDATEQPGSGSPESQEPPGEDAGSEETSTETSTAPEVEVLPPSEPVAISIPAISVTSPLHPLGLADDGTLEVPSGDLFDEAAWYDGSPTPGEAGPSVIEGHVTGEGGQPSVFFELGALAPGDIVEVDREDGSTAMFEIYQVDSHPKDSFPTVAVYGPTEEPELRVITCGGEVDEDDGHHLDNTIVYARLMPADS